MIRLLALIVIVVFRMRTSIPWTVTMALAVLAGPASAAETHFTTSCVATAGLAKHTAATTTEGTEQTGSYEVTLAVAAPGLVVRVEPKAPVAAGEATKVPAPINRVLLRSPYKSEAIVEPSTQADDTAQGVMATFNLEAIRALPAGDVNVVVLTPDGERLCRVPNKDRKKLVTER